MLAAWMPPGQPLWRAALRIGLRISRKGAEMSEEVRTEPISESASDTTPDAGRNIHFNVGLGEQASKGGNSALKAGVIAAIIVSIAIALVFYLGQKPPKADGEILSVVAHPQHTESKGYDSNGAPMVEDSFDQVLVFTHVKIHNKSKDPLFLEKIEVDATLADGIHTSFARAPVEYEQVFKAYPDIKVPHEAAFPFTPTLEPGQTIEGTLVANFGVTKQEWDARTGLGYTVSFRYQPSLVLAPKVAVTEQ
jgi:hypothetical protein